MPNTSSACPPTAGSPWVELPEEKLPQDPSQQQIDAALEKESQAIRAKLPPSTSLVCLCVEGRLRSSEELSALVGTWEHSSASTWPLSSAAPTAWRSA